MAFGLLKKGGVNVNPRGKDGITPPHVGVEFGSLGLVQLLIGKGAEIDARDERGHAPLCRAAGRKVWGTKISRLLVEEGADISAVGEDGCHCMVQVLFDGGADVNARDKKGQTPLFIAARDGNEEAVQSLLEERGAKDELADNDG
ncbi:ankyrin repeat-containing domain protein [Podospora didyma]|uniref:Ankyrin repeat-containing domain protein n=1 Tax=Podospora didyma TaxID=330526 RepID=A0AAE0NU68_9PEZI|nr:ankyrin repeat-containing domain protein [Podospora didyma]